MRRLHKAQALLQTAQSKQAMAQTIFSLTQAASIPNIDREVAKAIKKTTLAILKNHT